METTKKFQKLSLAALIVSLLPLAILVPVFLRATLPDGVRSVWAIANIASALAGLLLSVICVKSEESRSISENCKWGIRKRYERGESRGCIIYDYRAKNGKLVIKEDEAAE